MNRLEEKTKYLHTGIADALNKNNVTHTINRIGSMISVHFSEATVVDFDSAAKGNNETFKKFFHGMLNKGIYIAPSAFESWFITDALTYQDLNETIAAVEAIAKEL
jgi:glutamate-1-semialdehyde 2,1-aminomutase